MKTIILLSILLIGCIVEPEPIDPNTRDETWVAEVVVHLQGDYIDVNRYTILDVDIDVRGNGDTLRAEVESDSRVGTYECLFYRDTLELLIPDSVPYKYVKSEYPN